jgi:hypothetical protein
MARPVASVSFALTLLASACDGTHDGDPTESPPGPRVAEIVIPMQPRTEGTLPAWDLIEIVESDDGPGLRLDSRLDLAVGQGYPTRFAARFPQPMWSSCGLLEGEVSALVSSAGSDAVVAESLGDGIGLVVAAEGAADLVIRASFTLTRASACDLPVETAIPLDVHVAVRAIRPADVAFDLPYGCDGDAVRVAPSTQVSGQGTFASPSAFRAAILDEAGERTFVANAAPEAQTTVRLRGTFEAANASPASLAEWIAPPWPSEVEVSADLGEPLWIDVVDAGRVTAATVGFQIPGGKLPMTIDDGATYGGWGTELNRILPVVSDVEADETLLCSGPSAAWFQLESATPAVCEIVQWSPVDGMVDGHPTGEAARLRRDGACTLTLRALEIPSAVGLPAAVSATFRDVAGLRER